MPHPSFATVLIQCVVFACFVGVLLAFCKFKFEETRQIRWRLLSLAPLLVAGFSLLCHMSAQGISPMGPGPGTVHSTGGACVSVFCYSRQITVDRTLAASSNQTGFGVLVSISDSSMKIASSGGKLQYSTTQASGPAVTMPADLIFTSDSGGTTKIPWEIEFWDSANGIIVAWVKFDFNGSGAGSNSSFYMFYGNGDASVTTPQNTGSFVPANVWNTFVYSGVYHISAGPSVTDSTSGGLGNGTNHGMSANSSSQVDGGGTFVAASSQYVDLGNTGYHTTTLTVEAWVKLTTLANGDIVSKGYDGAATEWELGIQSSGKLYWKGFFVTQNGITNSTATLTTGTWYHVVGTVSGTAWKLYINGALDSSATGTGPISTAKLVEIGAVDVSGTPSNFFNGNADEVRISANATIAPADYVADLYANQNNPGGASFAAGFLIYGSEVNH